MRAGRDAALARDIRGIASVGCLANLSDGQLLDRFLAGGEEAAFDAILARHGAMVWGVCRRVLGDHHDAEDAFQATCLVLARNARSIRPRERLGAWLHGVARRTALKTRALRDRRRGREAGSADPPEPEARPAQPPGDWSELLDGELARLPEAYRAPVLLCDLGGLTLGEAADRLGWPVGTVSGRLSRARAMLAQRLARRVPAGLMPSLPALLAQLGASDPPRRLALATARALVRPPARILPITKGVLNAMFLMKCRSLILAALPAGLLGGAVAVFAAQGPPPGAGAAPTPAVDAGRDDPLARAAGGRIVRSEPATRDALILSYLPGWDHGDVDNLAIANNDGGVRTLIDWPAIPPAEALAPGRRFLLALYSRKTTATAPSGPILAFEVERDWPERTSWAARPGVAAEPCATYRFEPGEGWKLFDVTGPVQARARQDRPGRGILLRFQSEDARGGTGWAGYEMVSREGSGEWSDRRPRLLFIDPQP